MFEIGSSLREARMRQGLDFEEMEERTKVRKKYLRHLEDERNNPEGAAAAAKDVLVKAKRIDDFLKKHNSKLTPEVQSSWVAVRTDLERLARLYELKAQW